jgi:DNA helicase HerA-like ATPase
MKEFFAKAAMQNHPLRALQEFLDREDANEKAKQYDRWRFVGYAMEIGFDTVTIITSDPFKIAVGGVPRNSLLIMVPGKMDALPPHFTLLRVLEAAPTPLTKEVQQTYFELQKRSMPELDVFTQSELQWGALKTGVLGMFYPNPDKRDAVEFSGDLNNFVSAHKYRVYAPDEPLLKLITNALVPSDNRFAIGDLRLTECRLPLPDKPQPKVEVFVSTRDFMGTRTAMFGKTRLGKSNVVKLIAQSLIETTKETRNVGQLIFDADGEYANDNPQDGSRSLKSAYANRCIVYALTPKSSTPSRPLKLNFYEQPERSHEVLAALLREDGKDRSIYVSSFLSTPVPSLEDLRGLPINEEKRARRKLLIFWAILYRAGFPADLGKLRSLLKLDTEFNKTVRKLIHGDDERVWPVTDSLDKLADELERCAEANRKAKLLSSSGGPLFDDADLALLGFLKPLLSVSAGPSIIRSYGRYHDPKAGDFLQEIIALLDEGQTVILDLGNAPPEMMHYFSSYLSRAVFRNQVDKFSNNALSNHYVQLYFEEAHTLFPAGERQLPREGGAAQGSEIYSRIAKEGGKYHIGMVYSTQSVTTVSKDLLAQTENFFIAHMSSQDEVNALAKVNVAYGSLKDDILQAKTVGYIRMLTRSHRFVVSVQARRFTPPAAAEGGNLNAVPAQ